MKTAWGADSFKMDKPLRQGQLYTRPAIHEMLGGDVQSYLPMLNGAVVCGCFTPKLNLRAPREIDLGSGPRVSRSAEALVASKATIPVFLKQAANSWRYVGRYRATELSRRPEDLQAPDRRSDAVAVLFLEEADEPDTDQFVPDLEMINATEGRAVLRSHLARERKPILVAIKKRLVRAAEGALICEACGLRSSNLPEGLSDACFEVHHLLPFADAHGEVVTRIDDLALLCSNCHRMIHRTDPLATVSKLRARLVRSSAA